MNKVTAHWSDKLLRVTLVSIGVLLMLHLLGQFIVRVLGVDTVFVDELVWRFNVDLELNVPTWYSSFLAGLGALSAFFVAGQYQRQAKTNRLVAGSWSLIGLVMLAIAIDETAAFHELVLQTLHISSGFGEGQSYAANAWLLLLPLIAAALFVGLKIIYHYLPRQTFRNFAVAVGVYVLGAVIVEYLSIPVSDTTYLYNFVLTPLEEGLEMLGLWLVLRSVLVHLREQMPPVDRKITELWQ